MDRSARFSDRENWSGAYYELALRLGRRDDADATQRILDATAAMWSVPSLDGCYLDSGREPDEQERVAPVPTDHDHSWDLYGLATLPSGARTVCRTLAFREALDDERPDRAPADWLNLMLPLGALARTDRRVGAHPFEEGDTSRAWREPIDLWMVSIAETVAARVGFELGIVAFEADDFEDDFDGGPSSSSHVTYLVTSARGVERLAPRSWLDDYARGT